MLGSKCPDQEVAWEGALVYVCALMRVAGVAGQCVRDKKIRLRDEPWCRILALCH